MALTVLILAAGQGKRMHSDLAKVLQPLAGRPLLAHVLDVAAGLEAKAIHVVYGHGGEQVREAFPRASVHWVRQDQQLGTGHAVAQALPEIEDEDLVLVLYGDVPLIRTEALKELIAAAAPNTLALLSVLLENPTGYGRVLRDKSGRVYRIVEEKDATRKERAVREANTGVLCLGAERLKRYVAALKNDNAQGEYYLTDIVKLAVKDGSRVVAVTVASPEDVQGINDKEQLAAAEASHRARRVRELLEAGVTVVDPGRLDVRGRILAGRDVVIDVNVVLAGEIRLGDRARIGPGCVLTDCEVGRDSEVHAHSVLEGARIGDGCRVGPFARLRPGAVIGDGAHIGNFVEVKNARLGRGAKANHLTYLGDAEVGAGSNVGAGTITCNYDGANKWRTQIGERAFIGSGTMLVAPVAVGDDATIGAGSTITKAAPAGTLSVERSRQQAVPGWTRPEKLNAEERAEREAAAGIAPDEASSKKRG